MTQPPVKVARDIVFDDEKLANLIDRLAGPKIADLICYGSADVIRRSLEIPTDEKDPDYDKVWSDDTRMALGECMAEVFRGLTPEQKLTLIQKIRDNWKKGVVVMTLGFAGWDLQRTFRHARKLQIEREAAKSEIHTAGADGAGSNGDGGANTSDTSDSPENPGREGSGGEG